MNCHGMLIDANLSLLFDAADLIRRLDDPTYCHPAPTLGKQRVGAQFRHILEFYECFLDGLEERFIDYDARKRDVSIEASRSAALDRIRTIVVRLKAVRDNEADTAVFVRAEDAPTDAPEYAMVSSVSRELQAIRSHTIHHFAVIAMTLHAWGVPVDAEFGVAPSTLRTRGAGRAA